MLKKQNINQIYGATGSVGKDYSFHYFIQNICISFLTTGNIQASVLVLANIALICNNTCQYLRIFLIETENCPFLVSMCV